MLAMVDTSRDAAYGYDQRIEVFGESGMYLAVFYMGLGFRG